MLIVDPSTVMAYGFFLIMLSLPLISEANEWDIYVKDFILAQRFFAVK